MENVLRKLTTYNAGISSPPHTFALPCTTEKNWNVAQCIIFSLANFFLWHTNYNYKYDFFCAFDAGSSREEFKKLKVRRSL